MIPLMTRAELIDRISHKNPHLTLEDASLVVRCILDTLSEALVAGRRIEIRDFGSFSLTTRPARIGRNPKTGVSVAVPPKAVPHFKAGLALKKRVDSPAQRQF